MSCEQEQDLKIQELQINQKSMADALKDFKKENGERFDKVDKSFDEIKDLIKEVANGKANKWVEVFFLWAGAIIGAGLLTFLGSLIYKAIITFK